MNYYISDLHLFHKNVTRAGKNFDDRPFDDLDEMHNLIKEKWNAKVTNGDTVYILGDFCWGKEEDWIRYLRQMKGRKVLIRGNHDLRVMSIGLRNRFQDVKDYLEIKDGDLNVILCHYPIPFYKRSYFERTFMLFGHVHNTREDAFLNIWRYQVQSTRSGEGDARGQFYNVGCMMPYMDYTPRTLDEILSGV